MIFCCGSIGLHLQAISKATRVSVMSLASLEVIFVNVDMGMEAEVILKFMKSILGLCLMQIPLYMMKPLITEDVKGGANCGGKV